MNRILIILNPAAKRERAAERLQRLGPLPPHVTLARTSRPAEARLLAAAAYEQGYTTVVAAGGDGTINEVVNGIAGRPVTLGVLPVGTMNVFAAELGLPDRLSEAWAVIEAGHTREIDLGIVNGQHFVQLAGVGFGPVPLAAKR